MPTPGQRFDRAEGTEPYRPESCALDPRTILIQDGWNVRDVTTTETREHIAALKDSILARVNDGLPGLYNPIEVRYNKATGITTLVDGHCRLLACRELWDEGSHIFVPAIRIDGSEEQLIASMMTANAGQALTQWEIGVGCRRLAVGFNWSPARIAAHICKSVRYVNEALALAAAPAEARAMLNEGLVTAPRVLAEVREHGPEQAVKVLKEAVAAAPKPEPTLDGTPVAKPKPLKREKAPSAREEALRTVAKPSYAPPAMEKPGKALDAAIRALLAECAQQPDVMIFEVHKDTINALKNAWLAL